MNRVEIEGSVKAEPALHFTAAGLPIAQMTLAVSKVMYNRETRTDEVHTDWISVVMFGALAENVHEARYQPGERVHVLGELSQEKFEKEDGKTESKTRVAALIVTPTRRRRQDVSRYDITGGPSAAPTGPPPADPWAAPPTTQPPGYAGS